MAETYLQRRARELGVSLPGASTPSTETSGESYLQKRARELGVDLNPQPVQTPTPTSSALDKRRMELGIIPDTRPEQVQAKQVVMNSSMNLANAADTLKQQNEARKTAQASNAVRDSVANLSSGKIPNVKMSASNESNSWADKVDKFFEPVDRILKPIRYPFAKAAEYITPTGDYFGGPDKDGFTNPRDAQIAMNKANGLDTTGNKTWDKINDVIALPLAFAANAAKIPGINEFSSLPGVSMLASRAGAALSNPIASRVASAGVREGLTGAAQGAGFGLQTGDGSLRDITENAVYGAAGGTALGAAGGAIAQKFGPKLSAALDSFRQRSSTIAPEAETKVQDLLKTANKPYSKLRSAPADVYLNRAMTELQPLVSERMTPPLENPNELAKWLKPHLGNDISLNEIRKLPYDDMVDLASEVRRNLKTYDVANQVARERGIDLERLLNGKQPTSLNAQIERNRMGRVAGAIEAPSITPARAVPKDYAPAPVEATAEKMKGNWFTNLFGDQGIGISAMGSSKRISKNPLTTSDQIVSRGIKNDVDGVMDAAAAQARAAYQNFVDRLDPLKKVNQQTYDIAMDAGRANNLANTIVRDKFVTPEGEVIGEGLSNIFKKVARGSDKDFIDYLTLRHAVTRMERGERVYAENLGMTADKARERLAMYDKRSPEFASIAKEWDQFNDNMLQTYGVKEGLISEAQYKAMREANPNYSPMRRQFTRSEKPGRNFLSKTSSSSFSGQKAPIQKLSPTGSVRRIVDPRKTTIESAGAWANAAMRNRVMQSIVDTVKRDPEAYKGVVEIVAKPKGMNDLREALTKGGEDDFLEALNADFSKLFQSSKVDGDNIVRAMVGGEPVYMKVQDPELVKALVGLGPQSSNALIDVLSKFSNATKRGATGLLAPVFAVKGATMDLVQSAIQAKNPAKQAAYTVYSIFSGVGDRLNIPGLKNLAEEYRRAGGEYSAALKGDRALNKGISDMTRSPLLSPQGIAKGIKKTVAFPFKALESVGNIAENAPRMAAYKLEMDRLGARTPENVAKAMNAGREATVNFSRRGALSRDIEAFVPYNNAAVQGAFRVVKGIKDNPVRTVAAIGALSVLPKMLEYMQFADDPDYQNLPARERYRFLIVNKNEDGTFTKIPMDPAYNSFGELTIEALRRFKDNDPTAFKGAADALANAWTPPAVTGALQGVTQGSGLPGSIAGALNSTVAAPFVGITANKSFTGAPIVPAAVSDRSPQYQYDERTSSIAKQLGSALNMSPMQVDYLIRSYGGDLSRMVLPLTSQVGQGNVRNTLLRNFIVDPKYSTTLTNDFYAAKDKLNRAYRDNEELGVPLPSWYSEDLRKELTSTAKGSISKRVSQLNDQKDAVNADKSLSAQQRTDKLRELQAQINQIYTDVNSRLNQAGVLK